MTSAALNTHINKHKDIGIDWGLRSLITTSRGEIYGSHILPWLTTINDDIVSVENDLNSKNLTKKKRKRLSNRRTNLHQRVSGHVRKEIRKIFTHLTTTSISTITVEDVRNANLNGAQLSNSLNDTATKTIRDALYQELRRVKRNHSIEVFEVNPAYTSQECSSCGCVSKYARKNKKYECIYCANILDADVNAARVIVNRRFCPGLTLKTKNEDILLMRRAEFLSRHHLPENWFDLFDLPREKKKTSVFSPTPQLGLHTDHISKTIRGATMSTWTHDQLHQHMTQYYGPDESLWSFQCPACGDISSQFDHSRLGLPTNTTGIQCIGNYLHKHPLHHHRGCTYTATQDKDADILEIQSTDTHSPTYVSILSPATPNTTPYEPHDDEWEQHAVGDEDNDTQPVYNPLFIHRDNLIDTMNQLLNGEDTYYPSTFISDPVIFHHYRQEFAEWLDTTSSAELDQLYRTAYNTYYEALTTSFHMLHVAVIDALFHQWVAEHYGPRHTTQRPRSTNGGLTHLFDGSHTEESSKTTPRTRLAQQWSQRYINNPFDDIPGDGVDDKMLICTPRTTKKTSTHIDFTL